MSAPTHFRWGKSLFLVALFFYLFSITHLLAVVFPPPSEAPVFLSQGKYRLTRFVHPNGGMDTRIFLESRGCTLEFFLPGTWIVAHDPFFEGNNRWILRAILLAPTGQVPRLLHLFSNGGFQLEIPPGADGPKVDGEYWNLLPPPAKGFRKIIPFLLPLYQEFPLQVEAIFEPSDPLGTEPFRITPDNLGEGKLSWALYFAYRGEWARGRDRLRELFDESGQQWVWKRPWLYHCLGSCHFFLGEFNEAVVELERFLRASSGSTSARVGLDAQKKLYLSRNLDDETLMSLLPLFDRQKKDSMEGWSTLYDRFSRAHRVGNLLLFSGERWRDPQFYPAETRLIFTVLLGLKPEQSRSENR